MKKITWLASLQYERALRDHGLDFSVETHDYGHIDRAASLKNEARLAGPVLETAVEEYQQHMLDGWPFVRCVVRKAACGLVLADGIQRYVALGRLVEAKAVSPKDALELYVIQGADLATIHAWSQYVNQLHGRFPSAEERTEQAVDAVNRCKQSVLEAARRFGLAETTLRNSLYARAAKAILRAGAVDDSRLTTNQALNLHLLSKDEGAMVKLGALAVQHSLSGVRLGEAVTRVKVLKSDEARREAIKEIEAELSRTSADANRNGNRNGQPFRPSKPLRTQLLRALGRLVTFLEEGDAGEPFGSFKDLQMTADEDQAAFADFWKRLKLRANVLLRSR
jgi:hypothetical protein